MFAPPPSGRSSSPPKSEDQASTTKTTSPSCLLSILNVVVDHVMMPPSPMEPMEFREVCRWEQYHGGEDGCDSKCPSSNERAGGGTSEEGNGGGHSRSSSEERHIMQHGDEGGAAGGGEGEGEGEGEGGSSSPSSSSLPSPISMENISIRVPIIRIFGPVLRDGDCERFVDNNSGIDSKKSVNHPDENDAHHPSSSSSSRMRKRRIQQPQSGCLHVHGAFPYMLARPVIAGPDGSMHVGGYNYLDGRRSRIDWDDANSVSNILDEVHCRLEMALRASYEHHDAASAASGDADGKNAVVPDHRNDPSRRRRTPLFIRKVTIVIGRGFYTYCSGPAAPFLRVEYYDPSMRWRVKMVLERGIELDEVYHPDPMLYDHTADDIECDGRAARLEFDGDDANIRPLKFRCYEAHIPYTMQFFKDCNLAGMKYIKVGGARFRNPLPRSLRKRTKDEFSAANHADNDTSEMNIMKNDNSFFFSHTVPADLLWPQLNEDVNLERKIRLNEHWLKKQSSCDLEFDSTVQQLLNVLDVMTALPGPIEDRQKIHWRAVPSLREIWEQERKRMSLLLPPENDFLSYMEKKEEGTVSEESSDDDGEEGSDQRNDHVESNTPQFTLNVKRGASVPGTKLAIKGIKRLFGTSVGLEADFCRALEDILSRHKSYIDEVESMGMDRIWTDSPTCIMKKTANNYILTPDLDEGIEALAALGDQFSQSSVVVDVDDDLEVVSPHNILRTPDCVTPIASKLNTMRNYSAAPLSQKDAEEEMEMLTFGNRVDNSDSSDEYVEEEDDFLVEEERMGEAGLERALTQLATQAMEPNVDAAVAEVEEPKFEKIYRPVHGEDDKAELFSDDEEGYEYQIEKCTNDFEESQNDSNMFRMSNLSQSSEAPLSNNDPGVIVNGYNATPESITQEWGGDLSRKHRLMILSTSAFVVEPRQFTTLRCGEIMKRFKQSKSLHALPNVHFKTCPPWFAFKCTYSGAPPAKPRSFLEPVKRPPSYSQVKSWTRDQKKRASPHAMHDNHLAKQQKVETRRSSDKSGNNNERAHERNRDMTFLTTFTQYSQDSAEKTPDPLTGLGHQGGLVQISSGGGLKTQINTSTTFTPLTIMSIEIHVQCRINSKDQKVIAMVPDFSRDAVFAVVYVYCRDPGGGESLEILEKGCVLVMVESKGHLSSNTLPINIINATLAASLDASVEIVKTEHNLLLRIASLVKQKDPDVLVSWDTQGEGIGYLVERCVAISTQSSTRIDMARLLGRTPKINVPDVPVKDTTNLNSFVDIDNEQQQNQDGHHWSGSGLGAEWDDRVGSGAAASSIAGRVVLCAWKICAEEVKHPNASYQPAIVSAVLNERVPFHDDVLLTKWYSANNGADRRRVIEYKMTRAMSNVLLLDALDVLGRAGEAARLSGVEFSQSLPGIRGSQYKVEGVLLRALQSVHSTERGEKKGINKSDQFGTSFTSSHESQSQSQSPWKLRRSRLLNGQKPSIAMKDMKDMGYFFYSPNKNDCTNQEALECQAMTMEPLSGFHFDPVVVCDFTALYPSLVIAYNFCYSTIAGKLDYHSTRQEMLSSGRTTTKIGPFFYSERRSAAVIKDHLRSLLDSSKTKDKTSKRIRDRAYVIPTGSIFVAESVLKGVLPQVLDEMLSTRAMLKKAAKEYKKRVPHLSPAVLRQIEARQLALKYVANVTYGYTSATFSGRSAIPLVADAIVECGRRTLTNAIDLANKWGREKNGRWSGAHVLYGDTDSVFIKLPGRSVQEAFQFGEEYCKSVTASNPPPINLKLEKVYSACLLQTKKKYCGMMYESPTQVHPKFEAKGIETVRRDQCAVTQRILKTALIQAFQRGIIPVKDYLFRQWSLIHAGRLPVSDFILTGRVRSRYRGGKIGPVQASLARRLAEVDPGRVIRHKERLPYVIVAMPGRSFKLKDGVYTPLELLEQWDSFSINAEYYTVRHVNAALQRCFGLPPFKINVQAWYNSCPKPRRRIHHWPQSRSSSSLMISSYFGSDTCAFCTQKCKSVGSSKVVVCERCKTDGIGAACTAIDRLKYTQERANRLAAACSACNGCAESSWSFAKEDLQPPKRRERILGEANPTHRRGRLLMPMANCVCVDCPITYERHSARESEIEAMELCHALDLD